MSFTPRDVNEAVEEDHGWSEVGEMEKGHQFALLLDHQAFVATKVDNSHLGEGATNIWAVIEIDGRLFRKTGYHQSHDGTYWDGSVEEVKGREARVTVYDKV